MQAAALLFWLYASEGDIDEARRLLPSIPGGVPPGVVAIFAVNAARTDLDRARKLAELIPAPEGRATLFQLILANSPNPPATTAEIDLQIRTLPSPYDRTLAYLARAETAWTESQRVTPQKR